MSCALPDFDTSRTFFRRRKPYLRANHECWRNGKKSKDGDLEPRYLGGQIWVVPVSKLPARAASLDPSTPLPISESKSRPPRQWTNLLGRSSVYPICNQTILPRISSVCYPARLVLGGRPKTSSLEYDSSEALLKSSSSLTLFCPQKS